MKKKSLKGFLKTQHFFERQKQRKVSDSEIIEAITHGELIENEHGHHFQLNHLTVTVDLNHRILITVHPGDLAKKESKILSRKEAKFLTEVIEKYQKSHPEEKDGNEFLQYVKENSIKKL